MIKMNKYLTIILISFLITFTSKAQDITDFQIEGISIGDTLLNFLSKNEIQKKSYIPENSSMEKSNYRQVTFGKKLKLNSEYDEIIIVYDKMNNYKIGSVSGRIIYKNNINDCYSKMDEISIEISNVTNLPISKKRKSKYRGDKTGESYKTTIAVTDKIGNLINITCYDFSNKMRYPDTMSIAIASKNYFEWNRKKAFR